MRPDSRGFSLVETLVGMFLLSLALLAIAPLFVYARKSTAVSGDLGVVGAIAVGRMERLRHTTFKDLTAGGSLTTNTTGFVDTSNPDYVVRWRVTDNATPATLKTIRVRVVSARAVVGVAKEVTLSCVEAQR